MSDFIPSAPQFSWPADEQDFLTTIRTNPLDSEPYSVYADWLEERSDPRGEFLRKLGESISSGGDLPSGEDLPQDWLSFIGFPIHQALEKNDARAMASTFFGLARPAIEIEYEEKSDDEIPVGASKFNGAADLPGDFQWPTWLEMPDEEPTPLLFVAQFNLAELDGILPGSPLPKTGLLTLFGSMGDGIEPRGEGDDCQMFYIPEGTKLVRTPQPEEMEEWGFEPASIRFKPSWDLPTTKCDLNDTIPPIGESLMNGMDEETYNKWMDVEDDLRMDHHLFGFSIHDRTDNPSPGPDWKHLLTLGSDCGWCWCDGEHFSVFLSETDLKEQDFQRAFGYCS